MTFHSYETWWWPFLFILIGGWLATDAWRYLGVFLGGKLSEDSQMLVMVRCIATALVAAVIANLVVFPTGALANTPLFLRIGAGVAGFLSYILAGKRVIVGILVAEAVLVAGMMAVTS
ncbi:AzlD domain-containing protein [Nitratireductor basaltis]|uniref:Branched-chain amino acid transport n=1 Tax=Nitratireductor basaltis TaxID=472175 RepID=A0A084UB63_9HYPH|nr:AzlD domain-containing protein [Nitratireductor basaltis]KFB10199.1 Branched-chain amino acid transport [Nitratireductor basaltis]